MRIRTIDRGETPGLTERLVILQAVNSALAGGLGLLTTCREALEDAGYQWSDMYEKYVFENYVEKKRRW